MLSHHRILLVGEEKVILYAPVENGVGRETAVPWASPDFEMQLSWAFGAGGNHQEPVVVLFNEADHTYRKEENIPSAHRQRLLEAAFPGVLNRASLEVPGPNDQSGATSSYLFVGLPESEHLGRLRGALSRAQVAVAGFGLLPVESAGLVGKLSEKVFCDNARKSRWAVLAGQHETGGLRHVAIKDGNLALTRLIPIPNAAQSGSAAWAAAMMLELKATMTYLRRFGYAADDGMDMMVVCGEAEKKLFDIGSVPDAKLRCVTSAEALGMLDCGGITAPDGNNYADALHATWTERKKVLELPLHMHSASAGLGAH